jgi:hypothetical protein
MGGRASQVWPSSVVQHPPFRAIVLPPPVTNPSPTRRHHHDAEPEPQPEAEQWTEHTVTDVDAALGWRGRWLVRLVLRVVVHRRRP